jgi:hypothetical protein
MDGTLLTTTRNADYVALGTGGQRVVRCWDQISGYLEQSVGPAYARLFAEPTANANAGTTDWYAAGQGDVLRLADLPAEEQAAARSRLGALLEEIRAAVERLKQSKREDQRLLSDLLSLAMVIPDESAVWVQRRGANEAADAPALQPVLAGWGQTLNGQEPAPELLLGIAGGGYRPRAGRAPMRIVGPPSPVAPPSRWGLWSLLGGLLIALPLFLLLLWRDPFGLFQVPAAQCVIAPDHVGRVNELREAEAREAQLRQEIARVALELGNRRTACPPPPPPPPQRPAQVTPPAPPPAPPALPEDRWRRGDVSMLEGCWNLDSDYSLFFGRTQQEIRVRSWQMCFGADGRGRQTLVFENGMRCEGPAVGSFRGQTLLIDDTADVRCSGGAYIHQRRAECQRLSDTRAQCVSTHTDPAIRGQSRFTLRR